MNLDLTGTTEITMSLRRRTRRSLLLFFWYFLGGSAHRFPIDLCFDAYEIVVQNLDRARIVLYDEAGDSVLTHSDLKKDGSSTKSARFGESSIKCSFCIEDDRHSTVCDRLICQF